MTIYLDNAATTAVDPRVVKAMVPYFSKFYGNASEFHNLGRKSKIGIEKSREIIAKHFGADATEIIFTSGATESINLAIKGLVESVRYNFGNNKVPHIITSSIEHKSVIETVKHLERNKLITATYLAVNKTGQIKKSDIIKAITEDTVLVSLIYVNNEVGTIEPVSEIGKLLQKINKKRRQRIYFHSDITQAVGHLNCKIEYLKTDMLSFTGHKIYAPKGVGVLHIKKGTPITKQIDGGNQEAGLRASTENVPYIVGLGKAFELLNNSMDRETKIMAKLRNKLIASILKIPRVKLTGHPIKRVQHIASFVVDGVEGEAIVLHLSDKGIYASSGSACTASDLRASHVLTAMGIPPEISHGSLRLSLGRYTTETDIIKTVNELKPIIKNLRLISPNLMEDTK